MAWTYDPTKIATSPKDRLRFELGDVNENDPLLQDEEILAAIEMTSNLLEAKIKCAEALANRYAHEASVSVGSMSYQLSQRAELWAKKLAEYKKEAESMSVAAPSANAQAIAKKPYFRLGMHNYR